MKNKNHKWLNDESDKFIIQPPLGGKLIEKTVNKLKESFNEELSDIFVKPIDDNIDIWFYDYNIRKVNDKEMKIHIYKTGNSLSFVTFRLFDEETDDKRKYVFTSRHALFSIGLDGKLWKISFKSRIKFLSHVVDMNELMKIISSFNDFLNIVAIQDMNNIMIYPFKRYWLGKYHMSICKMDLPNRYYRVGSSEVYPSFREYTLAHAMDVLDKQVIDFVNMDKSKKDNAYFRLVRERKPKIWTDEEKKAIENLDMEKLSNITVDDVINSVIEISKEYPWDETLDKQEEK